MIFPTILSDFPMRFEKVEYSGVDLQFLSFIGSLG